MRCTPLALAAGLLFGGGDARAQTEPPGPDSAAPPAAALEPSRALRPPPRGDLVRETPVYLRAEKIRARPDLDAEASGAVDFRRAGSSIQADHLTYDAPEDLAVARGHVRIVRNGAVYSGPELQLRVQRFEGFFVEPEFEFLALGAGGHAERINFIDSSRAQALQALYTSCTREGPGEPDWVLRADRVDLDTDANEGLAHGAVLRFLGTPILAAPVLSFPLSDARKSGWLPPTLNYDTRSGLELAVPFYWNIAPNRDATLTPFVYTRRGPGLASEFRYLEPRDKGELRLDLLPNDRVADRSRGLAQWVHEGSLGDDRTHYEVSALRVSDDLWWKDFTDDTHSLTPRLLATRTGVERRWSLAGGEGLAYARTVNWQVLQGTDQLITPPYERLPQVGATWQGQARGLELAFETEANRFELPTNDPTTGRPTGSRIHLLGSAAWPLREPGWWVVPKVSFNSASYHLDTADAAGRTSVSRFIPTTSVDVGLEFERRFEAFGRPLRQTLEPRAMYVNTPFRQQSDLPNFDSAGRDLNIDSIYAENAFSGVDRVSDAHQVVAGVTSRLLDEDSGGEALRLGIVQRFLLRSQQVTPKTDGTVDGDPLTQRLSDVLVFGSTSVVPSWNFDTAVQISPDANSAVRTNLGVRYSPGAYRTMSLNYSYARGQSEQVAVGWQWPVYRRDAASGSGSGSCGGTLYGVGRMNYSLKDSRMTDSIVGVEYDAGCWIGRLVAKRVSTGTSEATTKLDLQIEFVGLSRLGTNPLRVLKDNIPGYRLLRDDRRTLNSTEE